MFQYILIGLAALVVFNGSLLESLAASGSLTDYALAVAVALMLKPWLQGQFE
jgi:hypothetical protein